MYITAVLKITYYTSITLIGIKFMPSIVCGIYFFKYIYYVEQN